MKQCIKCDAKLPLSDFYKNKKAQDGHHPTCKSCQKEAARQRFHNTKEGYWTVYYLPEEHYVGMTNNQTYRNCLHKKNGKSVDGYEVVAKFESAIDAHLFETMLHQRGYHGFGNGGNRK